MPAITLRASAASCTGPSENSAEKPLRWSVATAAVSDFGSLTLAIVASNGWIGARPALAIAVSSMHEP